MAIERLEKMRLVPLIKENVDVTGKYLINWLRFETV